MGGGRKRKRKATRGGTRDQNSGILCLIMSEQVRGLSKEKGYRNLHIVDDLLRL